MTALPEIIIAEDNPREREYLASSLLDYTVVRTVNGDDALKASLDNDSPCLVSDLQMPGLNGIELARKLWAQRPQARIVFWSHHNDEMYLRALSSIIPPETVYGYVLKDNSANVLQKAVSAVFIDAQCWIDPKLRPVQARIQRPHSALSDAEYEVLVDLSLGLTDNLIARRHFLSRRGAQSRLKSLYEKLAIQQETFKENNQGMEVYNLRTKAVATALHRGLLNPFEMEKEEQRLQTWLETEQLRR
jgi:DNA-binding NarL/FixJ family response regulator